MTFEEKIITNSSIRQKNLMRPAKVAYENPDTGVTINKKGAYYLIKDTADITVKYLAHICYASYKTPIASLNGLFTQSEIIDFVGRSKKQKHTRQLLENILTDAGCINQVSYDTPQVDVSSNEVDLSITEEEDVYGDYESEPEVIVQITTVKEVLSVNDASGIIQKLIEIFQATD
tara:strand:- start:957 stop:1481 length:525 start_codon:yes stop_codon:yes gene_type:complete